MPVEDRDDQPTGHDTIASIENNQLSDGKQVTVSPDNNHVIHATNHMRMMTEWLQMYQQDPNAMWENTTLLQKVNEVLSVAGPHFVKHLLIIANDPVNKEVYKQLNIQWNTIANLGDMIANNARNQRESQLAQQQEAQMLQQQYEQQQTPEQIKARGAVAVKDMKMRADIERDKMRESMRFALNMAQVKNQGELNRAKTAVELANQARKEEIARREQAMKEVTKKQGESNDKNKR